MMTMSTKKNEIAVSDYYVLAALDVRKLMPIRAEYDGRRYWGIFDATKAEKILADYENGVLKVVARDYVAALARVKTRIFERERNERGVNTYNGKQ